MHPPGSLVSIIETMDFAEILEIPGVGEQMAETVPAACGMQTGVPGFCDSGYRCGTVLGAESGRDIPNPVYGVSGMDYRSNRGLLGSAKAKVEDMKGESALSLRRRRGAKSDEAAQSDELILVGVNFYFVLKVARN